MQTASLWVLTGLRSSFLGMIRLSGGLTASLVTVLQSEVIRAGMAAQRADLKECLEDKVDGLFILLLQVCPEAGCGQVRLEKHASKPRIRCRVRQHLLQRLEDHFIEELKLLSITL